MDRSPRLDRTQLFFAVADLMALRSTCLRGNVGCVIVNGGRIVSSGYNGAPSGLPHCTPEMCSPSMPQGCLNSVHAEANAIAWAAQTGTELKGTSLYCTHGPCLKCAQLIINAGIDMIYYKTPYRDSSGTDLLSVARLGVYRWLGD